LLTDKPDETLAEARQRRRTANVTWVLVSPETSIRQQCASVGDALATSPPPAAPRTSLIGLEAATQLATATFSRATTWTPHADDVTSVPRVLFVTGAAGCGKTALIHECCRAANIPPAAVTFLSAATALSEDGSKQSGDQRPSALLSAAAPGTVVVLESAHLLVPRADESRTLQADALEEASSLATAAKALCGAATWKPVAFVMTAPEISLVAPSFLADCGRCVTVELLPPSPEHRGPILAAHLAVAAPDHVISAVDIASYARALHGYTGADLAALSATAVVDARLEAAPLDIGHLRSASRLVPPSALREAAVTLPSTTWGDIGGYQDLKASLRRSFSTEERERLRALHGAPPSGVLLFGPPGCSKTLMAKALANESGANFIAVKGADMLSSYVGETERALRVLFKRARAAAPCLVFLDECEALCPRDADSSGTMQRVVATVEQELDACRLAGDGVLVLGATNMPALIKPSLLQTGRLDSAIFVPPPDLAARQAILRLSTARMPIDVPAPKEFLTLTAERLEGFSGAEIVAFCRAAVMAALDGGLTAVDTACFEAAFAAVTPRITPAMLDTYAAFAEGRLR
jgi:SpoVK/Ycf46/Vps4 family AAA+-type ATPase